MKKIIIKAIYLMSIPALFLFAIANKNKAGIDPLTLITDESWEVSKEQTEFGVYPLSKTAILAAHSRLKGGSAAAVVANYYGESTLIKGAKPIWFTQKASEDWEARQFKKVFMLRNNLINSAKFDINCDDAARVYVNGQLISENNLSGKLSQGWTSSINLKQLTAYYYNRTYSYDVKPFLKAGELNTLLIEVVSEPITNGHAYVSAQLKVDFIQNTIAFLSENKPVIKPTIKPEKKPEIAIKKPIEKVKILPKKEIEKINPTPAQPIVNQEVIKEKPSQETDINIFKNSTDINTNKLKIGDIFELGNIYFKADNSELNSTSQATLLELATFLKLNKTIKIEIGGHTNLLPTNEYAVKLSSERAKSVMEFLKENGVNSDNLQFKGYGKNKPKVMEKTTEANQKNQRVEVKILAK